MIYLFVFSEKALYFVSKAHPMSKKPWVEWRLSFSLVEKEIFVNLPCLFRKVYLLCKTLTLEWKKMYDFPSYILKTTVLWTYEEWQRTKKVFTEDDLLTMIADIFRYLLNSYEKRNVRMYFIPELNLLEQQYSQTIKSEFSGCPHENVAKVKNLLGEFTNLTSLADFVCKKFKFPFDPIVQSFKSENRDKLISAGHECKSQWTWLSMLHQLDMFDRPSYHNLFFLYNTKILQNKGCFNKEDNLEILCEIYVTFLFFLDKIICDKMFGQVQNNIKDIQESLCKEFEGEDLPKMWLNGDFDNHKMSLKNKLEFHGNKEKCENFEKTMEENIFWTADSDFNKLLENINEYLSSNFPDRCLKEIMAAKERKDDGTMMNYDGKSYILRHLVDHMSEMYNYGFTAGKFNFPTPAVFMSYFSQFLLNRQVVNEIDDETNQNRSSFSNQNVPNVLANSLNKQLIRTITLKINGDSQSKKECYNYVTYDQCKYTTIPFRSTLMGMIGY